MSFGADPNADVSRQIQQQTGQPAPHGPGSGGKKQAPAPPDFMGLANQQTAANRPNQSTPFGFSNWSQGPDGRWSQQTGFNGPFAGAASDLEGQAAKNMSTPFDFAQFGKVGTGDDARKQAIDAAYSSATSRLDPQWTQREQQMKAELAAQGLDPESELGQKRMAQFGRDRNDAYNQADFSAIGQGTAAGSAAFNQNMMSRQEAIMEALKQRGMPMEQLSQLSGLLGMPGVPQAGNYLGAGGMNYDALMEQYKANGGALGGAGQILQAAGPFAGAVAASDERVKREIVRLPDEAMPGVPFATFAYLEDPPGTKRYGVIAQDLQKVAPEYVHDIGGVLHVDYSFLGRQ